MKNNPLRVAIAGMGTVGSGVASILKHHQGVQNRLILAKILEINTQSVTAKPFFDADPNCFESNWRKVIADPEIDVIVETIGGKTIAKEIIQAALQNGKHVVTANKDLLATEGQELLQLAQMHHRHLLFEASVCGAIPVVSLLENYFFNGEIQEALGIVNGTTNYIISRMDQEKIDFQVALKQAQDLGFAEQDPTNDIKGYDARYKLTILIYLITKNWIPITQIQCIGIDELELSDFEYAERMGKKIKLIAYLRREGEKLYAFVLPLMLPKDHVIAKVTGSTNIITLVGKHADPISLIGKGAGSLPTASAIVSNLERIWQSPQPATFESETTTKMVLQPFQDYKFKHTLHLKVKDQPGIVGNIGNILAKHQINIYALEQLPQYHRSIEGAEDVVIFSLTLEACLEQTLTHALQEINAQTYMVEDVYVLRELC